MKDKNGVEIRTGDTVRINGAYFKNSNGLFAVTSCPGDPNWSGRDICLKRICKNGELSIRKDSTEFWPLSYYCSDSRKNAAAREHDRENATIEVVEIKDKSYIAKYFQEKVDEIAQQAEYSAQRFGEQHSEAVKLREITEHYKKVVDRMSGPFSEQQAEQQRQREQAIREQAKEKSHSDGYDLSSVTMAPWMPEYMETKKKENEAMMQVMRFFISTFSIEELVQAIKTAPEPEVATPFLLELVEKDIKKAACMVEFLKEKFKGFTTDAAE